MEYEAFAAAVAANAPGTVQIQPDGRLGLAIASPAGWSLLCAWLIIGAVAAIVGIAGSITK
jgi:hypothetical protein